MISWGIIGLGRMANRFAIAIKEVENAKLLGIASKNVNRLNNFGEQYNIENKFRFNSYDEILNSNEINSIYISTLNNTHAEIIIKAARAKKNILCEKPVTTSYSDTVKVFETLNKSNVFFLEAIAYRTHPQTQFVINKIIEGEIGEVENIDSTFGFSHRKLDPQSRLFDPKLGGGAILDVGCYPVSFSSLIANIKEKEDGRLVEPEFMDVSGLLCSTGVEERAYATLKFSDKITARIGAAIRLSMKNQTLIEGSKGSILINSPWLPDIKSLVEIKKNKGYYKSFVNTTKSIFANQIHVVSQLIIDGKKEGEFPAMTWKSSINNMRVLDRWRKKLFEKLS